jgi:ribosomal protein S19
LLQREVSVYNGKEFIPIFVTKKMINHFFGEFAITKVMGKAVVIRKLERLRKKNKNLKRKK